MEIHRGGNQENSQSCRCMQKNTDIQSQQQEGSGIHERQICTRSVDGYDGEGCSGTYKDACNVHSEIDDADHIRCNQGGKE